MATGETKFPNLDPYPGALTGAEVLPSTDTLGDDRRTSPDAIAEHTEGRPTVSSNTAHRTGNGLDHSQVQANADAIAVLQGSGPAYAPNTPANWATAPTTVNGALDDLAYSIYIHLGTLIPAAATSPGSGDYSPAIEEVWTSPLPATVAAALDLLASALAAHVPGAVPVDTPGTGGADYTPATSADWVDADPDDVYAALDRLASYWVAHAAVAVAASPAGWQPYLAANAADWAGSAPDNVKDALDRIAAALGPIS